MKHQIQIQMKFNVIIFALLVSYFGFSQSHKATLSKIEKDGFHKITISPEVRSASQDNLDQFRILDKSKKEVPFVVFDNSSLKKRYYKKLKIYDKVILKDSLSSYTIYIGNLKHASELSLLISNTKINKTYSISGSNNQQDWFGLVSNQILTDLNNENGTSVEKTILFPLNNYQFLRIEFDDKKSLPINVFEIGCFMSDFQITQSSIVTDFKYKITEDKKNKKTIISFLSDAFQKVDGISFDVKTKLFLRNASVFVNISRKVRKRTENFKQEVSSFNLNSNTSNSFQLNGFFEKEFTIEIDNQDNQPLDISNIKVFQNTISLVADLKANEKYEVIIDSTLSQPNYDLANFTQNLLHELPRATITNLEKIDTEVKNDSEKSFWQKPVFLWSVILFTLVLLAYFVFSILKDVDKK